MELRYPLKCQEHTTTTCTADQLEWRGMRPQNHCNKPYNVVVVNERPALVRAGLHEDKTTRGESL